MNRWTDYDNDVYDYLKFRGLDEAAEELKKRINETPLHKKLEMFGAQSLDELKRIQMPAHKRLRGELDLLLGVRPAPISDRVASPQIESTPITDPSSQAAPIMESVEPSLVLI
ncbi:conserved hypothetical protein [Ricinus communis]|uniref:Uncharacterized protein n=1 Tax=Ricinus communis TaxID=3988 RepID=B9RE04_RICCO|nr:conserved hypothetical protein [Ricinus communis]